MAPKDWVEKAAPIWVPLEPRLVPRNVPKVTNHEPQIKNSKNIIKDNFERVSEFIEKGLIWLNC